MKKHIPDSEEVKIIIRLHTNIHRQLKLYCTKKSTFLQSAYRDIIEKLVNGSEDIVLPEAKSPTKNDEVKTVIIRCSPELREKYKEYCYAHNTSTQKVGCSIALFILNQEST